MRRLTWILVTTIGALFLGAIPAAAVPPELPPKFGAAEIIKPCAGGGVVASMGNDGVAYGYVGCSINAVPQYPIDFFQHDTGTGVSKIASPYFGGLLASAFDGVQSTYVLYWEGADLKLGRRDEGTASFDPPLVLSSSYPGSTAGRADLVAHNGAWWAVWSESVDVRGTPTLQLFQQRTLNGIGLREQISFGPQSNVDPSLALSKSMVSMSWTRSTAASAIIMLGTSSLGNWTSAQYSKDGTLNTRSDVATNGSARYLVWDQDGAIVESDDASGSIRTRSLSAAGSNPKIAVSDRVPAVSWTNPNPAARATFMQRKSINWLGVDLPEFPSYSAEVLSTGHKARVIYYREAHDIAIATQK